MFRYYENHVKLYFQKTLMTYTLTNPWYLYGIPSNLHENGAE
jgi:hypothetical protein